jgi:hypothetical protein
VKIAPAAVTTAAAAEIAAAAAVRAGKFLNIPDVYDESLRQMPEAFFFENVLIK